MREPQQHNQPGSFLLVAGNNQIDLRDFFALSGIDDTRVVNQIILMTGDEVDRKAEHSLLSSGHFDRARIFKAAVENGSRIDTYRGVEVLAVQPFPRDIAFKDVRWLAVIDQKIAIFGTISMVREELDRHLAGAPVDPSLIERLERLDRKDGSWCLVKSFANNQNIRRALNSLSPTLGDLPQDGDGFQFGIRFGGTIKFEYAISASPDAQARDISDSTPAPLTGSGRRASLLASDSYSRFKSRSVHGVLKLSKIRYEKWIADIAAQENARTAQPRR